MLQEIEKKHKGDPLTLLAVSFDAPDDQAKIPGYMKKNNLDCRVLLAGEQPVRGYNFQAASSLFVVDRKGMLAGLPGQFYYRLEKELDRALPDLLAGNPTKGPLLWAVKAAPAGFGELWRVPLDASLTALAVARGSAGKSLEIGTLDEAHHLKRYSATGALRGDAELEEAKAWGLKGADLDGGGDIEWIANTDTGLSVLDGSGKVYWRYDTYDETVPFELGGIADLDGDGSSEIIVRSGNTVIALRNVPTALWKNDTLQHVKALRVDGRGSIWAQTGQTVHRLDARGRITTDAFPASGSTTFLGSLKAGPSQAARLFGSPYQREFWSGDLDGDGREDLLMGTNGGLVVYSQEGAILLSLEVAENQASLHAVLADLDGKPGDELIIAIPNYGLVALGVAPASNSPAVHAAN